MKKIFFIVLLLAGSASCAFSQTPNGGKPKQDTTANKVPKTPEERATDMTLHMTKFLDLDWATATKVHDLSLVREQQLDALKAKGSKDKAANDAAKMKIDTDYDNGLKAILTPDQYAKWQARKNEEKEKHEHKNKQDSVPNSGKGH